MIDPVSTTLGVAGVLPLAADAVGTLCGRDEVKNFFKELRRKLKADGRIPFDKRDWIIDRVVGRTEVWREPKSGLQVDPHFLGCVGRLLDDGDPSAFDDMRTVLDEKLTLNEPDVDRQAIIGVIVDLAERSLGPAQATDRDAIHHEARRGRRDIADLREEAGDQHTDLVARHEREYELLEEVRDDVSALVRQGQMELPAKPVFLDIGWAPDSVQRGLAELGRESAEELEWVNDTFSGRDAGEVAREITRRPPREAATGSLQLWTCVARFAERAGDWETASAAWLRAAERAEAADRVSGIVSAAVAANVGGDDLSYDRLMEEATRLDENHPRVRLEHAGRCDDPHAVLDGLKDIVFDNEDHRALLETHRALAHLRLGDLEAAERHLSLAEAERPEMLQVRSIRVNMNIERQRLGLLNGDRPDVYASREAAQEALSIREKLIEQARWEESSRMLMLAADGTMLAGDVHLARRLVRTVREAELSSKGGLDVIATAASRLGDHRFALKLVQEPDDDDQRRIKAAALAAVGTDAQAREASRELDQLVESSDDETAESAALTRLLMTLTRSGTEWSDKAAERLAGTSHSRMATSLKANWLGRNGRYDEVEALLEPHKGEPWALEARFEALQSHPDESVRKEAAERVLLQVPEPSVRFSCGITLYDVGERERGLAEAKQVARDRSADFYVRTEAFRFLVSKEIEDGNGKAALQLLGEWAEIEPQSEAMSALFVPAAALLTRGS